MALIKKIWEELAKDPQWFIYIISKTPSLLRVNDFGNMGISLRLTGDTQPMKQWDVMGEFRRRIKATFDKEGIEFAVKP